MQLLPGRLVKSIAGRDRGQSYLVCSVMQDGFVHVVDGRKRPLARPKRKNPRHLKLRPAAAEELATKWEQGETVEDAEVRAALATLTTKFEEAG